MKKQFSLFVAAMAISISSLMAQAPARQMQTPEERTKVTMEKLADFNLKTEVRTKVESILTDFYKAQQTAMQEMRASGGGGDRSAFQEKRKQLSEERDSKLKKVFTAEEYAKWISDIEPSLRPQRQAPPAAPAPASAPAPTTAPAKPN